MEPDLPAYAVDQAVEVLAQGKDEDGDPIECLELAGLDAKPIGHHTIFGATGSSIRFDAEGIYELSAASATDPDLKASKTLVVDRTPPVIVVTAPERGLTADAQTQVVVKGTIEDNLGKIGWLEVAGKKVSVSEAGGLFSVPVPLEYAVNSLIVRAADPYENVAEVGRAVLWSPSWYALTMPSMDSDGVSKAVVAILGQEGIDDGDHNPAELDDLATIVEVLLSTLDLTALLPNPLTTFDLMGATWSVRMTELSFKAPKVSLELITGGLHAVLSIEDFAANVQIDTPCGASLAFICGLLGDATTLNVPGTLAAGEVSLETDLIAKIVGGELSVEATKAFVDIKDTSLYLPDPTAAFGGYLNQLVNAGSDFVEPALVAALEAVLPFVIESQVKGVLGAFANALTIDQELELPAFVAGMDANRLGIQTHPSAMTFALDHMRLVMDGLAYSKDADRPRDVPGGVRFAGCGPAGGPPVPPPHPMLAGLHEDLLNELLFAMWEGGRMNIDLGPVVADAIDLSMYGVALSALKVDALLPPVLNGCTGKNRLQVGDLYVEAALSVTGESAQIGMWLQLEAPIQVGAASKTDGKTEVSLAIGDFDSLVVESVKNLGFFEGDEPGLIDFAKNQLLPILLGQLLAGGMAFELPSMDVGSLSDAIPAGTALDFDVESVSRVGGYVVLSGTLK